MTDTPGLRTCLFTDSTQKENHERLLFSIYSISSLLIC